MKSLEVLVVRPYVAQINYVQITAEMRAKTITQKHSVCIIINTVSAILLPS